MKDFEIKIENYYPKIRTPYYLKDASNRAILFEEFYPNVKKPSYTTYKTLKTTNNELKIIGGGIGCVFFILLIGLVVYSILSIFFTISIETYKTYWRPTITTIAIIGGIAIIILGFKGEEDENEEKRNQDKINRNQYLIELDKYNKLLRNVQSNEFQNKEKIKRCLKDSVNNKNSIFKYLEILKDGSVKKGISEEFFYKFLVSFSDFKVYKSIKFSFYYPDLILVKNNLVIALEIDEPYSFDSKEPIHYENSDSDRNDYFVKNGFILIRFSEEQIVSDSEKCLELINEIVASCLNLEIYKKSRVYMDLQTRPWTYEEAFDLAYNNSRINISRKIQNLEKKYLI